MNELDHLLAQRAQTAQAALTVPDALMARILADAVRTQPRSAAFAQPDTRPRHAPASAPLRLWQTISDLFGGGGVVAGLATAACAGIYLGAVPPEALSSATFAFLGTNAVDQLDFMPSIDVLLAEE